MTACWIAIALKATLWAGLMSVAALVVPSQHPQVRRGFALLGMWGLWVLPWLPLPWSDLPAMAFTVAGGSSTEPGRLWLVLKTVWVMGSVIFLLRVLSDITGIERLVRQAQKSALSADGIFEVRFTEDVAGPCMTGWLRPCVLLPVAAASWPEGALNAALRHECQHARQMDGLHRFCAALVRACFWWNPAMHALCSIYEAESEVCCDEAATKACSRQEYGEMLLAHATQMPMPSFALPFARSSGLRARMQRLLATRRGSRWLLSARWLVALALFIGAAVLVASVHVIPSVGAQKIALKSEARLRLNADPFPWAP
ncbi:M56 family metallopeptidase [Prosthecobacter fluviatilis]|uniref:M56 family metallopeptidase n=1 Tax=Prosthecobacter fluviatilis TaxID=445931 RepID=A0ABW0KQF1_9BACT